jgi:hypothetical protein
MPVVDLTRYVVAASGVWTDPSKDQNLFDFTLADTYAADHLMLRWAGDFVALTGPLRVRVTVLSENMTLPLAYIGNLVPQYAATVSGFSSSSSASASFSPGAALYENAVSRFGKGSIGLQASTIYTYILDIAAGQAWPFSLSEQLDSLRLQNARLSRFEQLGNNLGYRVIIEPAFTISKCEPVNTSTDLPCDFAVANQPNTASFFPSACEPCNGSVMGLPPSSNTVSLIVPPADGGCVRTRFFNGMFITREDLETEQRYQRLKSRLHNRASGAGVVWGLNVARQGSAVCVMPGYGVDCCGNDLALTSVYQVEIAALLADPAAASQARYTTNSRFGNQRFSLLLEYVECPADPRPVHGDPCSPDASRCEMSRIRESVRLRLVSPCDYDAAKEGSPIQKFLDEVRTLRAQYPLGAGISGSISDYAPFRLRVAVNGESVSVRPSPSTTSINLPSLQAELNNVTVEVQADQLWTFVAGTISGSVSGQGVTVNPPGPVDLSLASGFSGATHTVEFSAAAGTVPISTTFTFKLANWQMQNILAGEADPAPSGDLTFTLQTDPNGGLTNNTLSESSISTNPLGLADAPCSGAPCAPSTSVFGGPQGINSPCAGYASTNSFQNAAFAGQFTPADPTPVLPWLHTDPTDESRAGDPKALIMAALGGWLAQMLVREQVGTASSVNSSRREIAQGIYRIAWLLLFGIPQKADPAVLGCTLQRLLEALCDELLWTGPVCTCEPHGVVIGCALVEGGTIQRIDPFDGRRYVIHYPLLAHWGAQFGIAPLDISLMRFFSRLCCVSSLRAATVDQPSFGPFVTELGAGYIAIGEPDAVAKQIQEKNVLTVRRVSTPEIIASALSLIGTTRSSGGEPPYTAITLADLVADQTVTLLIPVAGGSSFQTGQNPSQRAGTSPSAGDAPAPAPPVKANPPTANPPKENPPVASPPKSGPPKDNPPVPSPPKSSPPKESPPIPNPPKAAPPKASAPKASSPKGTTNDAG